ncbi:hypothetical protein HY440_02130 [Candidatus Microgenomates bacterium]|nr:hypothetical protein [Candidatus Microgenomates bacterium]
MELMIVGIILLLFSLEPFFIPDSLKTALFLTLFYASFCFGIILVSDAICQKVTGRSTVRALLAPGRGRWRFFILAVVAGFAFDGAASYFGALWFYPFYSTLFYLIAIVALGGFIGYWLTIVISYDAAKEVLDEVVGEKDVTRDFRFEKTVYKIFLVLGIAGTAISLHKIGLNTNFLQNFTFNVTTFKPPYLEFSYVLLLTFSLLFVFEFVEYYRHRTSLIKDVIHGYWNPLVAIVLISVVLGIYMEGQNLPIRLWVYVNWPWQEVKIFGLPILVLVVWPLQYVLFLSFYRAFGDRRSEELWTPTKLK